ncbi:hypothetical protein An04g04920 [Aspergillus niger]|uniref:Uncharacterized protein n=2 Tax=Aspergillus niger TaxID=5061 RepID=A2QIW0_ASPNC|nr:hypothetical protein An04g04920 [Aspergillus niger]CAK38754.1 hypothetical protein An04g04920 [Aspergillus niger]
MGGLGVSAGLFAVLLACVAWGPFRVGGKVKSGRRRHHPGVRFGGGPAVAVHYTDGEIDLNSSMDRYRGSQKKSIGVSRNARTIAGRIGPVAPPSPAARLPFTPAKPNRAEVKCDCKWREGDNTSIEMDGKELDTTITTQNGLKISSATAQQGLSEKENYPFGVQVIRKK